MASAWIGRSLACLLLASLSTPVIAEDAWKVEGELRGKPKKNRPAEFKSSKDVSGIACDSGKTLPRLCLVADDETQGVQVVLLKKRKLVAGGFIKLTNAQYDGKPVELDAEGVAFEAGRFYVIGSHGRARHEESSAEEDENNAKAAASRQLFRITLPASAVDLKTGKIVDKPDIKSSSALVTVLSGLDQIKEFYDQPLTNNGLTIEGLAVRDQRLFIGMRGPVLGADAIVLSMDESAAFDGRRPEPTLHRLALDTDTSGKPRGVRDLARYRDGFLVLAGPVNDPPEGTRIRTGDYSIYFWDGNSRTDRRVDLESYGVKTKPEALLPLDGDADRVRVLLMFDGPENGSPISLEINLK